MPKDVATEMKARFLQVLNFKLNVNASPNMRSRMGNLQLRGWGCLVPIYMGFQRSLFGRPILGR